MSSKSRINYIEPNYVNGLSKNGVDFSVPLDDLCISVDLIAEVTSRNSVTTSSNVIVSNAEVSKVSFFEGIRLDNEKNDTFLTTYFTDITYEDTNGKYVVEGLGISSINISFDSWYMPLISINFVDVRGSSIFTPNEYENENAKKQFVTSDKIYKCFFTFPYPKFKLVVKGFYGNPVTFQLTCSKFNGKFNSTTGNFEATATFIGYNYSLLTDINFNYLISAPKDNFYGKSYFDSKKNSDEWRLSGGEEMPRLDDLLNRLTVAGGTIDEILNTDETSIRNKENDREQSLLNSIYENYKKMISSFNQFSNMSVICENSDEIVYGMNFGEKISPELGYTKSFVTNQNNFISSLKSYNEDNYFKSKAFKKIPNDYSVGDNGKVKFGDKMSFSIAFNLNFEGKTLISVTPLSNNGTENSGRSVKNVLSNRKYNNNRKLTEKSVKELERLINEKSDLLKTHIYIFKKNGFENDVKRRLNECERYKKKSQRDVSRLIDKTIKSSIGFIPTVGNMCKILFAHMETFLHSIFRCMDNISSEINNGKRTFDQFGISISQTDLNYNDKDNNVLAFPLIASTSNDSDLQVNKWVGDIVSDAQEAQLVNGYIEATTQTLKENEELASELENGSKIEDFCQINPCDFSYSKSPFSYVNIETDYLTDLIAHIGTRSCYLFGILMDTSKIDISKLDKMASKSGELDACNYYLRGISKDTINKEILEKIGTGDNSVDKILNILCCTNNEFAEYNESTKKYRYPFELVNGTKFNAGRNSIYLPNTDYYKYIYMFNEYDGNDNMIVPTNSYSIKDYMRVFVEGGTPFKFPDLPEDNYNYMCATLTDNYVNSRIDEYEGYTNISVFNIFSEDETKEIYSKYNLYKNGTITARDYNSTITNSEMDNLFKFMWHLDKSDIKNFYKYSNYFIKDKLGIDESEKILPSNIDDAASVTDLNIWKGDVTRDWVQLTIENIVYDTFEGKDDNIYKYSIPDLEIRNNKNASYSLFGNVFYYMQNEKFEGEDNVDFIDRSMKSKALLFLSCIPVLKDFIFNDSSNCGGLFLVPKSYALYIGGLLWRERYFKDNNRDCFVYSDGIVSFREPYQCANGNRNELYKYTLNWTSQLNKDFVRIEDWGKKADERIFKLRTCIKNSFIKYFEDWCENYSSGFSYIANQCELFNDSEGKRYLRKDIEKLCTDWNVNYRGGSYAEILGEDAPLYVNNKKGFLKRFGNNFLNTYCSFKTVGSVGGFRFMFRDDTDISNIMLSLFSDLVSVGFGCYNIYESEEKEILIRKSALKSYVSNFIKTLKKISDSRTDEDTEGDDISFNKDVKIAMYNYFKSIHDKWLIGCNENYFDVGNFFTENFLFVDTFFRDISDKLIINCDYFARHALDIPSDYTMFSFLADLFSHHGMIFTPMSHYNNWAEEDTLSNMFKPYAYNQMPNIDEENKFICMYVHEPSKNLNLGSNGSSYGFSDDSFMISDIELQPSVFLRSNYNADGSLYGYPIPAFGVSFGKMNQSYFKNISVSMDNPITTEYAIKAIGEIANLGKNNNTKIQFIGQDIYSVYANYSYFCEVEMMGCAQIQPLMYFQLTNIPMFRGTYIITKVTHDITPGKMVTKFTGCRMSKFGQPFNTIPFANLNVLAKNFSNGLSTNDDYDIEGTDSSMKEFNGEYVYVNPETVNLTEEDCNCETFGKGWSGLTDNLKKLFYAIKSSVEKYQENKDGIKWTICVSSGQDSREDSGSDHNNGTAMDLQIVKGGKVIGKMKNKNELGIVFEIICMYYYDYIKQLIIEFYDTDTMNRDSNIIKTVHLSSDGKNATEIPRIFQAYVSNGKDVNASAAYREIEWKHSSVGNTNSIINYGFTIPNKIINNAKNAITTFKEDISEARNKAIVMQTMNFVSIYYKNAASNYIMLYYPNKMKDFKTIFSTFGPVDNTTLYYYFDLNSERLLCESYLLLNKTYEGLKNQKRCNDLNKFRQKLNDICFKYGLNSNWMMGVMVAESGLDPSAVNKSSKACGLIQFTEAYYKGKYKYDLGKFISFSAEEQLTYVERYISEWVDDVYKKNEDEKWSGFKHPVDAYLIVFAPSILTDENRNANTVIYRSGTSAYNANSSLDIGGKGYITIHDMEIRLFNKIKEYAKQEDYEILNSIIEDTY